MKNKLMKQEIRESGKLILFIYAYIAVLSIVTIIMGSIAQNTHSVTAGNLMVVFLLTSMMGIVVIGIVAAGRFYNLLFTDEGLIRLTIPVKNREHLKTNVKLGIMSLYPAIILFCSVTGFMDDDSILRVDNLFRAMKDYYEMNLVGYAGVKALVVTLGFILAFAVVIANLYITFLFVLTVSRRIVSKYGIMQKGGVICIVGIVLFNIQLLVMWGITNLIDLIEANYYLLYELNGEWVKDIILAMIFIAVYGITAFVMYRICRNIMDCKLEV